jgi:nitrite reductase/ring-hydroxylating ferredoxin subunit
MGTDDTPSTRFPDGRPENEQPKWRRDFPIDIEADEYGARRDFTKFMVLTSAAFACGQFWIALQSLFRGRSGARKRIASVADVAIGQAISFHFPTDRDPCLLIRQSEDVFLAYSSVCTHLMCPVRPDVGNNQLHCPCHEGFFDLASGNPTAGPPRRALPKIELQIERGEVYATAVKEHSS